MAASSQAVPATTAAVIGGGPASNTGETIVGSHVFRIDGFSKTKDLGVGKCIKSSTFRVGGHGWYIECYPCGVDDDEDSAGFVYLFLCREQEDHPGSSRVSGYYKFTLMEPIKDGCFRKLIGPPIIVASFSDGDRHPQRRIDLIPREVLEWRLKDDDCFQVRCVVFIEKFPAAPPPDLTTGTMAGSRVLTVDGYSETRRAFAIGEAIESIKFRVGGRRWCFDFYPCGGEDETKDGDRVTVNLCLDDARRNDEVKVRFQITLLTRAGQIISSTQDFRTFSDGSNEYVSNFLITMEHESSPLLQDGIQIRCDVEVVNGITATPNLRRCICGDLQGSQQVRVRGDVTFEVSGHLFPAHKCVLATRCTTFMAEFFGPAGVTDHVRIVDMEPKVFEALLHFIYTDALPVVDEEKILMAQGLLVAADKYGMERLKLICGDLLCSNIKDARTAVTTLDIADKHGCLGLKEACMKFLMDQFANVAP